MAKLINLKSDIKMKAIFKLTILGFAHLTFTLPMEYYPLKDFNLTNFQNIVNHPQKKLFMLGDSELHNIALNGNGIEITYYEKLSNQNVELVKKSIANFNISNIISQNFNNHIFEFLLHSSHKNSRNNHNSISIGGVGRLNHVTLAYSETAFIFERYLDSVGTTGLAFYVDNFQVIQKFVPPIGLEIYFSEPFEIFIGVNKFMIMFAKYKGVNFEFLKKI